MLKYQRGDIDAFVQLVQRHRTALFNYILLLVHSRDLADRIQYHTLLTIARDPDGYDRNTRFSTWLYSIARTISRESNAATESRPSSPPEANPSSPVQTPTEDPNPTAPVRFVDNLADDQRDVFLLREVANLPFAEIALITSMPEDAVKSHMRFALDQLRDAVQTAQRPTMQNHDDASQ
ncbi:MAG: hypothetical protein FWD57_12565 [Polyangiaceae bacterium]|nr:hypothetical protein [Polyangiaceae bacterium]